MSNIEIEFPDGAKKEFATATTVREVAATISNSLAKKAVGANFAGKVVGLNHQLKSDGKLAILTKDQPEALPIYGRLEQLSWEPLYKNFIQKCILAKVILRNMDSF